MKVATELRPKLKQDSIFLATNDGVLFRNSNAAFSLKGKSIYRWISSLAPHLTGEHTLEELCATLEPRQREMATRLVQTLLEKGVLKNHMPETSVSLPEAVSARFRPQIEFIDHYADRPLERFQQFRQSRVMVMGAGVPFSSLAAALLRNGLENLRLAPTQTERADLRVAEAELESLKRAGVSANLQLIDPAEPGLFQRLSDFDVVAYCSDRVALSDVYRLNAECFKQGCAFLPAIIIDGQSLLGPMVKSPAPGCWLCGLMRLSTNLDARLSSALWQNLALGDELLSAPVALFDTTASMLGNAVALELFKAACQHLNPESRGGLLIQNLDTLESGRALLLPHPLCPVCSRAAHDTELARLAELCQGPREPDNSDKPLQHLAKLIGPQLGLFRGFTDDQLVQLPLRATSLALSPAAGETRIYAYDEESTAKARQRALSKAVEQYAATVIDRRRMVVGSLEELRAQGLNPVAAPELDVWTGSVSFAESAATEWLPAYSFATQSTCHVPAAAVYRASYLNRAGGFVQTAAGAASGRALTDVRAEGIVTALGYERLRNLSAGRQITVRALDLQAVQTFDPDLAFLIKSARHFSAQLHLLELTGEAPISVIVGTVADDPTAIERPAYKIGCHTSWAEASRRALLELVGALQMQQAGSELLPTDEPLWPDLVVPAVTDTSAAGPEQYEERPAGGAAVDAYLQRSGRDALFVNTTPQDVWETNSLITGTILLTRPRATERRSQALNT